MNKMERYNSVIGVRYGAPLLSVVWSPQNKIQTMRDLWIQLALIQKELGIESIMDEGIEEMRMNQNNIDYDLIERYEKKYKHDIMAHIHAYGDICPKAKSFIHLGVTSNFINDNSDSILIKRSFDVIKQKLDILFDTLKRRSLEYKDEPTLAYTHFQRAQLITVGKRFTMWNSDILLLIENLRDNLKIPFRGVKGTVGSEDTILKLFKGNHEKCKLINKLLSDHYGFDDYLKITGQTYSRLYDVFIFQHISSISQTLYKIMNDIRLLMSKMEIQESFSSQQIGSSAMPYKMNPITCEKICSITRYLMNLETSMNQTYMNQWLERSLDDSALKRIILPEAFLLLEHVLDESIRVIDKLVIHEKVIEREVETHFQHIISENIIVKGVEMGYDRQELHERIRQILIYKNADYNKDDILREIIEKNDIMMEDINKGEYIGRCVEQIEEFYKL